MTPIEHATCAVPMLCGQTTGVSNLRASGQMGFLSWLLDTSSFPRRWYCGSWTPALGWLHISSDLAIFAAYISIPLALLFFLKWRRDIPFPRIVILFSAFILSCGIGHAVEALIFWFPAYRFAGLLKAVTAIVSWATVLATIRILPQALKLPDIARLNQQLQQEADDRLLAEHDLRIFQAAVEYAKDAILISEVVDPGGSRPRVVYVNPAFYRTTGEEASDVVGSSSPFLDVTEPRPIDPSFEVTQVEHPTRLERLNHRDDGSSYWVELTTWPVADESGRTTHWVTILHDITTRKQAEEERQRLAEAALRQSREQLQAVVQAAPVILFSVDSSGTFTLAEGRGLSLIDASSEVAIGRSAFDVFQDSPKMVADLEMAVAGASFEADTVVAGRTFECRYTPKYHEDGEVSGSICVATDITERMRSDKEIRDLNARLEQRLRRLFALRQIDMTISSSLDLGLTLGVVLDQVLAELHCDGAAVLLNNPADQTLSYAARKGFRNQVNTPIYLRAGEGFAGRAAIEQSFVGIADLEESDERESAPEFLASEGFVAYHAFPLLARGHVRGVLEVYHRKPFLPDRDWVDFFEILAGQTAIAIDNASLFRALQRSNSSLVAAYDATIEGWAHALDLRDKETEGHSRRVTEMTIQLARAMGLDDDEIVQIRRGALLHDIGKLGIPDAILLKPGPLDDNEREIMQRHPVYAHEWLSPVTFLRPALDIPYCHHEKWDGTGYPRGIKGHEIPLSARIFAAVDIWDALRSDRPYRPAWPESRVVEHIKSLSGSHLDPQVVKAFLHTFGLDKPKEPVILVEGLIVESNGESINLVN
ncbi:HD domain-containing phosphohydrolase [Singulisphaera sp. PoT]|uniref:HD domain-containing phosphohydrolase n=1 Tax=Singulisphaera sp. PoT TaxID=3411797 RepID=UPI003BF4DC14